tara:strand:- start:861 stop:992 length:132 start_codon:yes stop_codon:yes gene_type:complete
MQLSPTEYRYQVLWPLLEQKAEQKECHDKKVEEVKETQKVRTA